MKNRSLGSTCTPTWNLTCLLVYTFVQRCRVAGTHSKQAHVPGRWRGDATASGMMSKRHSLTKGVPSSTLRLSSPRPAAPSRYESQASPETDCRFTAKAKALLASMQALPQTENELKSLVKDLRHVLNCQEAFLEEHSVDSVHFFPLAKCVPSQCLSAKCLQEESCSKMRCDYWIGFCRKKPPLKWLVAFTRALWFRELASSMVQGAQPSVMHQPRR